MSSIKKENFPALKEDVKKAILSKELRMKIADYTGHSEQSVRLWVLKNDINLLAYPIMKIIADHLKTSIDDLLKF